jgi:uncharacterized protein (TIGR03083 family)
MEYQRLLSCLDGDFTRLRQLVARDPSVLAAPVPSCPEWTVDDLVRHVAYVYLHKIEYMRTQQRPENWPPDLSDEPTLALLDRSYAELTAEFAARKPDEPSPTWYEPEQTVGFWIRRMAQETVIHRVDAELAVGEPFAEIPDDLALDGVDEVLERFLAYGSVAWREDLQESLPTTVLPPVLVRAGERGWLVRPTPGGVELEPPVPDAFSAATISAATISGAPVPVLLWLWRRADEGVTRSGDPELIDRLSGLLKDVTQ